MPRPRRQGRGRSPSCKSTSSSDSNAGVNLSRNSSRSTSTRDSWQPSWSSYVRPGSHSRSDSRSATRNDSRDPDGRGSNAISPSPMRSRSPPQGSAASKSFVPSSRGHSRHSSPEKSNPSIHSRHGFMVPRSPVHPSAVHGFDGSGQGHIFHPRISRSHRQNQPSMHESSSHHRPSRSTHSELTQEQKRRVRHALTFYGDVFDESKVETRQLRQLIQNLQTCLESTA